MLQNGTALQKRYVTENGNSNLTISMVRQTQHTVTPPTYSVWVSRRFALTLLAIDMVRQTQQNSTNHIQGLVRSGRMPN
jgi:hypothetical protein